MANLSPKSGYYPFIDGLRAVAILLVLFHHVVLFLIPVSVISVDSFLGTIAAGGQIGVDLFFVISGFLITGIIIGNGSAPIHVGRFYARRFFKIYPQYVVCLLACLLVPLLFPQTYAPFPTVYRTDWHHLWPYFIFLQNYVPQPLALFSHAWSLAVEEHFYIFYPLLVWMIFQFGREKDRIHLLVAILVSLILLVAVYRAATGMNDVLSAVTHAPALQTTLMRIDALIAGCLIKLLEPYLLKLPKKSAPLWLACGGLLWSCLFLPIVKDVAFRIMLAWMGAACLFIAGLMGWKPWNMLLENRLLRWTGKNSYGIYLWHYPLILLLAPLADRMPLPYFVSLYLTATLLCGAGSTATVERIALSYRERVAP